MLRFARERERERDVLNTDVINCSDYITSVGSVEWLVITEFSKNCIAFEYSVLNQTISWARVSFKKFRVAGSRRLLRLLNTKVHCRVHQSTPLDPMTVCLNPLYDFTLSLKSNLILSFHLGLGLSSPSMFSAKKLYIYFSFSPFSSPSSSFFM